MEDFQKKKKKNIKSNNYCKVPRVNKDVLYKNVHIIIIIIVIVHYLYYWRKTVDVGHAHLLVVDDQDDHTHQNPMWTDDPRYHVPSNKIKQFIRMAPFF